MIETGFLKTPGHCPDARAVFDGNTGEWFTRAQLACRVSEFAGRLQFPRKALGFLFAFNDSESLIAYLAAVQAGHAVAMLNPELDEAFRAKLTSRFRPDFIVAPKSHPQAKRVARRLRVHLMESPHPDSPNNCTLQFNASSCRNVIPVSSCKIRLLFCRMKSWTASHILQ
jgi:acyl-CoA synthetase (AMP-forming)/AMP-acid ligase II